MNELAVFAKYWKPGCVKTRLAAHLGDRLASELYQGFVETLLERLERCGDRRAVHYSPCSAAPHFRALVGQRAWQLRAQASGDLGHRMARAVEQSLQAGARSLLILGSDSPSVPLSYIRKAFEGLERCDVVLGPSEDGGYYLIGLRRSLPQVFQAIEWSSCRVWQQTIDRLHSLRCAPTVEILPRWYDVDSSDDLDRLIEELAVSPGNDAALAQLGEQIRRLMGR